MKKLKSGSILRYEASEKINFECPVDYIIHGAGIAYPKMFTQSPVETMQVALYGTDQMLKYGVKQKIQRMVFISSSEVYGKHAGENLLEESEYGYIDLLNPRSSYSMGKRAKRDNASAAKEYNLHVTNCPSGTLFTDLQHGEQIIVCLLCLHMMQQMAKILL